MEKIKRVRKAKGLSLTQLAKLTGLHDEAIARAEREGIDPRASTIATIAKGLGVPMCELFEESGHGGRGNNLKKSRGDARSRSNRSKNNEN